MHSVCTHRIEPLRALRRLRTFRSLIMRPCVLAKAGPRGGAAAPVEHRAAAGHEAHGGLAAPLRRELGGELVRLGADPRQLRLSHRR